MESNNPKGLFSTSNFDFLYKGYSHTQLMKIKKHLVGSVKAMMKWEKDNCAKANLEPLFDSEKANKVSSIIDKCQDYYELEALRKALFDLNYVPESYEQVKQGADVLRAK